MDIPDASHTLLRISSLAEQRYGSRERYVHVFQLLKDEKCNGLVLQRALSENPTSYNVQLRPIRHAHSSARRSRTLLHQSATLHNPKA